MSFDEQKKLINYIMSDIYMFKFMFKFKVKISRSLEFNYWFCIDDFEDIERISFNNGLKITHNFLGIFNY